MADEKFRKATEGLLNSVLISSKGGVPLYKLAGEFREVTMSDIPLEKLGFQSIESYIRSIPHCAFLQTNDNGVLIVKGVANESTKHIAKLVSGQKKGKKRSSTLIKSVARGRAGSARGKSYRITRNPRGGARGAFISSNPFNPTSFNRGTSGTTHVNRSSSAPNFAFFPHVQSRAIQEANRFLSNGNSNFSAVETKQKGGIFSQPVNFNLPPRMRRLQESKGVFDTNKVPGEDLRNVSERRNNETQSRNTSFGKDTKIIVKNENYIGNQLDAVKENVIKVLSLYPKGLWANVLCHMYKIKIGEVPPNLLSIVKKEMNEQVEVRSMHGDNEIIYLRKPKEQEEKPKKHEESSTQSAPRDTRIVVAKEVQEDQAKEVESHEEENFIPDQEVPKIGETFPVYVCHVDTIDRFFVQRTESEIMDLSSKIQAHYQSKSKKTHWKPKIGGVCCACYQGQWYRARVIFGKIVENTISTMTRRPSGDQNDATNYVYKVLYIDYGNMETVGDGEIQNLEAEFCTLPAQAIQCRLRGVMWTGAMQEWSSEAVDFFKESTEDVQLKAKVSNVRDSIIDVDLRTADGKSIAEALVDKGLAISENRRRTASLPQLPKISPEKEETQEDEILSPKPSLLYRLNSLTLDSSDDAEIKQVELPKDDIFDILVTAVNCLNEVSAVLDDDHNQGRLKVLEAGMQIYFDSDQSDEKFQIEVGCVYAAFFEEAWYRVKVTEIWEDTAETYFVDRGDSGKVQTSFIKKLPPQFKILPLQAIELTLANLPESDNPKHIQALCDAILGKECVAVIFDRDQDVALVELFDTSSGSEVRINDKIATDLNFKDEEVFQQFLPDVGEIADGFVSNISESGLFNVCLVGPGVQQLDALNEELQEYFSKGSKAADFVKSPEAEKIVCAKLKEDSTWCRAITKCVMAAEKKAEIEFIDYGTREVVNVMALREIPEQLNELRTHPAQTIKCKLADCPNEAQALWKNGLASRLLASLKTKTVVIKSVKESDDSAAPLIQILQADPIDTSKFTSIADDITEICASLRNAHLPAVVTDKKGQAEPHDEIEAPSVVEGSTNHPTDMNLGRGSGGQKQSISSQISHSSASSESARDKVVLSARNATVPSLEIKEYWIVIYVTNVQSPSKFHFVLHDNLSLLSNTMERLLEHYKDSDDSFDDCCEGDVCAVLVQGEETWYRGIIRTIDEVEDQVGVLLPDVGKMTLVPITDIRPLHDSFLSLPFQAIKGSLADLPRPPADKWPKTACKRFADVVFNQGFYAKIKSSELTYPASYSIVDNKSLELTLFDPAEETDDLTINELVKGFLL